jgi:hypothetical protein
MDPYLEGYLCPDVHNTLASKIRQQLTPKLRPHYTARLNVYVVEDSNPESEVGILYPNVEMLRVQRQEKAPAPQASLTNNLSTLTTPATLTLPVLQPVTVRLVSIEIRDTASNILVTCIEILSPVNKREPGLTQYRHKRQRLYNAGVHLIELDLLRRGTRAIAHPRLPNTPYVISLTRAQSTIVEVWSLQLQDPLPVIPIPLRSSDPDIALSLPEAIAAIYDEAAYDLSIDYTQPPPPPALSETDAQWLRTLLS